jgi:hypothetical protein
MSPEIPLAIHRALQSACTMPETYAQVDGRREDRAFTFQKARELCLLRTWWLHASRL